MLAAAWVIGGAATVAWRHRGHLSWWNAALVLAVGIEFQAIGMTGQTGIRLLDMFNGLMFPTRDPIAFGFFSALVILGKTCFVWLVAMREGRDFRCLYWFSYWSAVIGWTMFAIWRACA
jgi:hypothetical protein